MNKYPTSNVIAALIREKQLGTDPATFAVDDMEGKWPVFTRRMPDDRPNELISVRDLVVPPSGRETSTGRYLINPGFILRVRSVTDEPANQKIVDILNMFETIRQYRITYKEKVHIVTGIHLQSGPVDTGQDSSKRHVYSANFITSICEV